MVGDIVLECSGKFKTVAALQPYLQQGVKRVVVSSPVKEAGALNVVMGVNDHLFNPAQHQNCNCGFVHYQLFSARSEGAYGQGRN